MKFRTKPVEKEAFRFGIDPRPDWFMDKVSNHTVWTYSTHCVIKTLEGEMIGNNGDWIIKGLHGELYPCKPDVFDATYEKVD